MRGWHPILAEVRHPLRVEVNDHESRVTSHESQSANHGFSNGLYFSHI